LKVPIKINSGLSYLHKAIQLDFIYVVFDFAGSGVSDGKYISLGTPFLIKFIGFYESFDL